jgi:hypothetical protein
MLDLEDLKTRLTEYDPAAPKCQLRITRHRTITDPYGDYNETTHAPCCRPEGHEDECRNARQVIGWPGFQTVSQLVAEVERLREMLLNAGWPRESDDLAVLALQYERAAVVAWLRAGASNHQGFGVRLIGDELDAYANNIESGEHRREEKD